MSGPTTSIRKAIVDLLMTFRKPKIATKENRFQLSNDAFDMHAMRISAFNSYTKSWWLMNGESANG